MPIRAVNKSDSMPLLELDSLKQPIRTINSAIGNMENISCMMNMLYVAFIFGIINYIKRGKARQNFRNGKCFCI